MLEKFPTPKPEGQMFFERYHGQEGGWKGWMVTARIEPHILVMTDGV